MKVSRIVLVIIWLLFVSFSSIAFAGFDWGNQDGQCSGSGHFNKELRKNAIIYVGQIPKGKLGVVIKLFSEKDIDIQLYDKKTNKAIIAYPYGILSGPHKSHTTYGDMKIEWSGYKGDCHSFSYSTEDYSVCSTGTSPGNEYIRIDETKRDLIMKVYAFRSGIASVQYSWNGTNGCSAYAKNGQGFFTDWAPYRSWKAIDGVIPAGIENVAIFIHGKKNPFSLTGHDTDVDVQLHDISEIDNPIPIVAWPDGKLNGTSVKSITYKNATISWTGYYGFRGSSENGREKGTECIIINGKVPVDMKMFAYGYEPGQFSVDYVWGLSKAVIGRNGVVWHKDTSKIGDFIDEVFAKFGAISTVITLWGDNLGGFVADFFSVPGISEVESMFLTDFLDIDDPYDLQRVICGCTVNGKNITTTKIPPDGTATSAITLNLNKNESEILFNITGKIHPDAINNSVIASLFSESGVLLDSIELFKVSQELVWQSIVFISDVPFYLNDYNGYSKFIIKIGWENSGSHQEEAFTVHVNIK